MTARCDLKLLIKYTGTGRELTIETAALNGNLFSICLFKNIQQYISFNRRVQVGNDQEMAQSQKNSDSINRGVGKN